MKRLAMIMFLAFTSVAFLTGPALAEMGMGKVTPVTTEVGIQLFGSLKTFPHFVSNMDFNDDDTPYDWLLDENGIIDNDEITVRNEIRLGMKGGGENWKFMTILESDFSFDQGNADRGSRAGEVPDLGMRGEDFGVEKLEFSYDFSSHGLPATLETGWNTTWADLETGGLFYGDDHPYISLFGSMDDIKWELLGLIIKDAAITDGNGDDQDWQAYIAKVTLPAGPLKVAPFYGYSDNQFREANVHYLGIEAYGKMGNLTPKAEFVYALGDKDNFTATGGEADISAYGGFAAIEASLGDMFNPYFGGYLISGDDDANDEDIEAFNPITNIARYAGPFGIENAFIYRGSSLLGNPVYSNAFERLGGPNGYGGISNAASANSPGMYTLGLGTKGGMNSWAYKTQFQYFWLAETGALEDLAGTDTLPNASDSIDDVMGWEFDLQITYHFSKHFSLGNVVSIFDPGDGIEDLRGPGFDEMAFVDTIEMKWTF